MKLRASPNHGPRAPGSRIEFVILHYTGMPSARAALERLCDPGAEVSAHYLVEEDGTLWALVEEARRAWHAGRAFWRGVTDINSASIGIELVNPGHEHGYRPFPAAQMAALEALLGGIVARHAIAPTRILAHSDVAPLRKSDPGELFDWRRLAAAGLATWPDLPAAAVPSGAVDPARAGAAFEAIGYQPVPPGDEAAFAALVTAFQRHWRPSCCDGTLDAQTLARAEQLGDLMRSG